VKGNQSTLLKSIVSEFDRYAEDEFSDRRVCRQTLKEKNRGRQETRTCVVAPAPAEMKSKWAGLKTIGLINRTRKLADGTEQEEQSYFISSLEPRVRVIATHLRNHWGIENGLHHTLDVTFGEDHSRIRKGNGPEIISAFRRMALSILKQDITIKDNVRGKRMIAGWDLTKLKGILLAFQAA
jgi:predicted transposase YbfD/YdcC